MQNTLIMNKLPLPRYFDGDNWNTVFKPTRKSIPKYLHDDLPQLKLIQLKERFKQIGKFNCPRLQYFDQYIRKHNTHRQKKQKSKKSLSQRKEYERTEEQLQYALLLCDWNSPVLDELVSKSRTVRQAQEQKGHQKNRYFPNTIDLVFRNRKSLYLSQQQKRQDDVRTPSIDNRVQNIKLLPFH